MGRKARQWSEDDFKPGEVIWVPSPGSSFPPVPRQSGVNPMLLAALYAVYALDQADDETADPDWAVEVMENLYEYLGQVKRPVLLRELEKLIAHAQKSKWPRKLMTLLKKDLKHFSKPT